MQYQETFKNLKPEAVQAVKDCSKNGCYRVGLDDATEMVKTLAEELSVIYDITTPDVFVDANDYNHYVPMSKTIYIDKISLISFLHEFRHYIQHEKGMMTRDFIVRCEHDARGWSMSMFYKACPVSFQKSKDAGRIMFTDMNDVPTDLETEIPS